jgi:hypothetical protein
MWRVLKEGTAMSERGLLLALQRLHDDPGFVNLIAADPQNTVGIYDLDDDERQALIQAVTNKDEATLKNMASKVGIDWTSDRISGAGALDDTEDSIGRASRTGLAGPASASGPSINAFSSENVSPYGSASPRDDSHDAHTEP